MKQQGWSEFILFSLVLLTSSASIYIASLSPVDSFLCHHRRLNCLVIGTDGVAHARHADTIFLLSYEPETRFLDILSIPRDIKAFHQSRRKLAELFAVYYRKGGTEEASLALKKVLEERIFKGELSIPFYFTIDYSEFKRVVDLIGGVQVKIDRRMDYDDKSQDLHIHFSPGWQRLDGASALEYVRFRHDGLGDKGRILRQQYFIQRLFQELSIPDAIRLLADAFKEKRGEVATNLNSWDFLILLVEFRNISRERIRFQTMPCYPKKIHGRDYLILKEERAEDVIQTILSSKEVNRTRRPSLSYQKTQEKIVVEVFNATNRKGLAYRVSRSLRLLGVDVVRWDNYGPHRQYTTVIDRRGNMRLVDELAKIISCPRIKTEIDYSRMVDATIVLGEDFQWKEE